jgi:hypothetical protein
MNVRFDNLDVKIKVSFLFNRVSLVQFVDLKPPLKAGKIIAEVEDARQVDQVFASHDVD